MALNTPKRIKTLKTLASSPGSDCGLVWRDYVEGSVSPASSCDSPEFVGRNHQHQHTHQRQPPIGDGGSGNSNSSEAIPGRLPE